MSDEKDSEPLWRAHRPSEAPPTVRPPAVWVLEDSPTQGALIADVLSPSFAVRLFERSPALLEALQTEQPEALVLDWYLPEVSGLEVLRTLRLRHDVVTLPVLVLTASEQSDRDVLIALEAGANDFARKPFVVAELKARLSTLVHVRLLYERALRAEQQHRRVRKQLEEQAEFEEQLVGIVSHDLGTPLSAVLLSAALLSRAATLTEEQSQAVHRIVSSAGRAQRMVRDLLDFTAVRLGHGLPLNRAPMNLHGLTARVISEIESARGDHRIEVRQSGRADGSWDGDRIAQVIVNLTTNALQYSSVSSKVVVETRSEAQWAVLSVWNDGPPISDESLPRLFSPMQRGSQEHRASQRNVGLGLFIVDGIVRAHHGSIEVRSSAVQGTTFTVRLPRGDDRQLYR